MEFGTPVKRETASFNCFMGKLVVIVPHKVVKSTFPKTNSKGESYFPDQTIAHLIPVELTEGTYQQGKNAGKAFRYEAGEPVLTYIGVKARTQLGDFGTATLGRIGKGEARNGAGAPTILKDPTPDEVALATSVLADFDITTLKFSGGREEEAQEEAPVAQAPVVTPERVQTPPWKTQG